MSQPPDQDGRSQLALLRAYGIKPVKRRGQNFLLDTNLSRAIAQDALALGDHVLELGAGGGALTVHLLEGGARVTCVEVDRHLCALLRAEFGAREGFRLIEDDLARLDWEQVVAESGPRPVVAGNLPYVLTSKVLFALADRREAVAGGVFMVQKEVAERLVAPCGSRDYGILAVVLGSVFAIRILRTVPANVFWPRPEVASAVVELRPAGEWAPDSYAAFTAFVRTLFGQRRKKLRSLLRSLYDLDPQTVDRLAAAAQVDAEHRPEHIDPDGLRRLAEAHAALERN